MSCIKEDLFLPGNPKWGHTLRKAIHERIAHSSVWPRCSCPWSARYSDGFHGRRLSGTNRPTWNEFPAEHFFFRPRTFCSMEALAFSCPEPSRLIGRKSESEKDGLLSIGKRISFPGDCLNIDVLYCIINNIPCLKKNERLLVRTSWGSSSFPTCFN